MFNLITGILVLIAFLVSGVLIGVYGRKAGQQPDTKNTGTIMQGLAIGLVGIGFVCFRLIVAGV